LGLDVAAWTIYARGAKARGKTLAQVLTEVLIGNDLDFEDTIERETQIGEGQREREAK
jgi:hypothetical protein